MEQERRRPGRLRGCGVVTGLLGLLVVVVGMWLWYPMRPAVYVPVVPPAPPVPNPNGLDSFVAAADLFSANGGESAVTNYATPASSVPGSPARFNPASSVPGSPARFTPAYWAGYRQREREVVAKNGEVLRRMRAAALLDGAVPPPRSITAGFPYLGKARALARLEAYRMDVLRAQGDHCSAVDAGLETLALSNTVSRNGVFINWLCAFAVRNVVRRQMVDSVEHLTPAQADGAGRRMDRFLNTEQGPGDTVAAERAEMMSDLPKFIDQSKSGIYELQDKPEWMNYLPPAFANAWGKRQLAERRNGIVKGLDEYFTRWMRESEKPMKQRGAVAAPQDSLARDTASDIREIMKLADEDAAANRLLRCQLAIQAYRGRHGHAPASLSELHLDARWTSDPYTGSPFLYRPRANDYRLYSVGPNLSDDGGGGDDVGLWRRDTRAGRAMPGLPTRVPHMEP